MKLKFLTSLIAAGVMLVGTSAFALTAAQQAAINTAINGASTANLGSAAAAALAAIPAADHADAVAAIISAAKAKMGPNASIASVRNLVNALVQAAPTRAGAIVQQSGGAFPSMKANIAAAAQAGLATAASTGAISQAQSNTLSSSINQAAGVTSPSTTGGGRGGSLFQANQVAANAAARAEFQKSNQNNYGAP